MEVPPIPNSPIPGLRPGFAIGRAGTQRERERRQQAFEQALEQGADGGAANAEPESGTPPPLLQRDDKHSRRDPEEGGMHVDIVI